MKFTYTLGTLLLGSILLTGGCSQLENFDDELDKKNEALNEQLNTETEKSNKNKDNVDESHFVRVQDYTGEGYKLRNSGNETQKIAEANKQGIETAVKKYLKEKYKTEIIVHNIVGAKDGASVFIESLKEPNFHTLAIVPIDIKDNKILPDQVFSEENEIESAIQSGLYSMIFRKELTHLDNYINKLTDDHPITGITNEALNNISVTGYTKPSYFVSVADEALAKASELYLKNPSGYLNNEIHNFKKDQINASNIFISINFYMKNNAYPDKAIFNNIVEDIKSSSNFPPGNYVITLNDNRINKVTGIGEKDNSLSTDLDQIIKK